MTIQVYSASPNRITMPERISDKDMRGATRKRIPDLLRHMQPFIGNSMHAHRYLTTEHPMPAPSGGGKLPLDYRIPINAVYVVFSYITPIAWVTDTGEVTIPPVHYSNTTTKQQSMCRAYMGIAVEGVQR